MQKKHFLPFLVTILTLVTFLFSALPLDAAIAQVGGPGGCTPDPTGGGCPTEEPDPADSGERAPATRTPFPTATPLSFSLPQPSPEFPFRPTPFGFQARPTATQPLGVAFPLDPDLDLEAWAIEVTQGLQDLENRMPLVARRGTVIRVYVRSKSGTIQGVRGIMQITQNGKVVGIRHSDNQPITAYADGGDRLDVDSTLNFSAPIYTRDGDVNYKVFVYPVNTQFPYQYEVTAENNFFEVDVEYQPGSDVTIVMPSIHMHMYDEDEIFLNQIMDYESNMDSYRIGFDLERYYPVVDVKIISWASKIYPTDHKKNGPHSSDEWTLINNGTAPSEMMAKIQVARDEHNYYSDDFWYGMLDPTLPWWWNILDEDGNKTYNKEGEESKFFATGFSNGTVAIGLMLTNFDPDSPWWVEGGVTGAHEGGHNYGLGHYLCNGNEDLGGGIDPNYPYPEVIGDGVVNCSLAAVDPLGFYGFDWGWGLWPHLNGPTVISNDPAEAAPNRGFPTMGYRRPQYVDVFTYCTLLNQFGVPCNLGDLGVSIIPDSMKLASLDNLPFAHDDGEGELPEYLENVNDFLRVYGAIGFKDNVASFTDVIRTDTLTEKQIQAVIQHAGHVHHAEDEGLTTPYMLSLEDASGNPLFSLPLYNTESPHEKSIGQSFNEVIPFVSGTKFIRIRSGEAILAERRVSNNAPKVSINTQNRGGALALPVEVSWSGIDPDGEPLTYTLQYSYDGGENWTSLLRDLENTGVIIESFDGIPGSENGFFRVVANDGVNTAFDANDVAFTIPDSPPVSTIVSPVNAFVAPQGGALTLTGQSIDMEDGFLAGESLEWTSDIDGLLGTDEELIVYSLSPGVHEIKLTGIDSKGQRGEAIVYVNVDPNNSIALPSQQEIDDVTAFFAGDVPEQARPVDAVEPVGPESTATPAAAQPEPDAQPAAQAASGLPLGLLAGVGVGLVLLAGFFALRNRNK
ncbi:MAG: hypothetical protein CVU44_16170 [Chloroflexi bacterium HGW-Chloroflexi-6]|nr:MAG: hypothetical protein CVU44_16170 [Chloroflexi bacterium HGW-Chloroflexi-6]